MSPIPPRRNSPSFVSRLTCCPSFGRAPSATTTSELKSPAISRARMASATLSKSNGISGIRITSAPPAIPPCSAIQPACRPITSTTMARLWLVAVVWRRSSASITAATAESKPKVMAVASRSLSIVFGTPTQLIPASCNCKAVVIEPSPPTMMSASTCASFRTLRAFSITSAATTARSPAPILATKCPRFVVPISVPPSAMMFSVHLRSSTVKSPGGNNPSKPSRNPSISQPSLSAASAAPRKTALSPGQSPPLVRIPIRVFIRGRLQHLFRIDQSTGSGPLIVKLPTLADEPLAITKSIVATKNYDDEVARKNGGVVAILDYFGGAISRKNEALTGTSGLAGFDAIDSVGTEQIVGCFKKSMHLFATAVEGNIALLLRNVKTKARLVHRITGESREIDCSGIWHRPFLGIEPTGINKPRPVHPELFGQRIHLRHEDGSRSDL